MGDAEAIGVGVNRGQGEDAALGVITGSSRVRFLSRTEPTVTDVGTMSPVVLK